MGVLLNGRRSRRAPSRFWAALDLVAQRLPDAALEGGEGGGVADLGVAGPGQVHLDDLLDPAGPGGDRDDPVGEVDRLVDRVGDEDHRGRRSAPRSAGARSAGCRGSARRARRRARPSAAPRARPTARGRWRRAAASPPRAARGSGPRSRRGRTAPGSARARGRRSAAPTPRTSSAYSTFSSAVRQGNRAYCWKT